MSLIGKRIGNYHITQLLGQGGMGAVYLGEHPVIGKRVAVKVLHEELAQKAEVIARFFAEAKAVNDIHHDNIVDVVDLGQFKDELGRDLVYFTMELLEGESLTERLQRGRPTVEQTNHIIDQCASALSASHSHGIVHRDIKPDNIHLVVRGSDDCFVKLLDFGIAKLTGSGGSSWSTNTGALIGTPIYMSPEQCEGRGNIDYRSDIYSLGIVLYELLCGRPPFLSDGFGEVIAAHLTAPIPPPSQFFAEVAPPYERVAMRCLEKRREARYQSMDELREALQQAAAPDSASQVTPVDGRRGIGTAPTLSQWPTTLSGAAGEVDASEEPSPARGRSALVVAGVVLGVAALSAVAFVARRDSPVLSTTPVTTVAPVAPVVAPAPVNPMVKVVIDSVPPGASVRRAGVAEPVGVTPLTLELRRGEPPFDVQLSLPGWRTAARAISSVEDRSLLVPLDKEPPKAVAPKSRGAKRPSSSNSGADPDAVMMPQL